MSRNQHVVVLIHGIRTQGEWAQGVASLLEINPTIRVRPMRYGFLDVVSFLLPLRALRQQPVNRIKKLLRDEFSRGPTQVSIIAHSFGTYITAKILEQEADLRFSKVLFCGSIVPDNFDWERYGHRLGSPDTDWQVINDCGTNDVWPVLAQSITWGYGSSGRFGFGHPRVKDRFFAVGHGGFFSETHIKDYWLPYLADGEIRSGITSRPTTPWFISILTVTKLRFIMLLLISGLLSMLLRPPILSFFHAHALVGGAAAAKAKEVEECRVRLHNSAEAEASMLASYPHSLDPVPRAFCERLVQEDPSDALSNSLFGRSLIVEGKFEEAIAHLEQAAQLGDVYSNEVLGRYYLLWHETDRPKAFGFLAFAAKHGDIDAEVALGKVYELGTAGSPDYAQAVMWYQRASDKGNVEATFRLAQIYENGLGTDVDVSKARKLYRHAAVLGDKRSLEALDALANRD